MLLAFTCCVLLASALDDAGKVRAALGLVDGGPQLRLREELVPAEALAPQI